MFNVPDTMDVYRDRNMAMPFGDIVAAKSKAVFMPFAATGLYQPAVGKPMYFQPDHELDGGRAIIRGIEIIDATQQASFEAQGVKKDSPTLANLHNALLYICNIEREIIATIPLYDLAKRGNSGKLLMTDFRTHVWQGCYVEMVSITGLGSSVGLQFTVYYDPI
jgi:hypothetical protein